ncbi:outer membrane lipoprotein chaperone LolA, partial [Proteus mirabilis]
MKKVLLTVCAIALFGSQAAWADARQDLQQRLNKVNSFQANFSQTVTSNEGALIQKGEGHLKVQRPDLFNWQMTAPDESTLISDGKTLWFYNPFVEQVTATWLESATTNTPFMLIARNDSKEWQNYDVKQNGDRFELTPKTENNLKHFSITVSPNGQIQQFA